MTLRSLERFIQSTEEDLTTEITPAVQELKNRLFYSSGKYKTFYFGWRNPVRPQKEHNNGPLKPNCCFIDIMGRPQKNGKDMPLLPYQRLLFQILNEKKCILIKKARGIGVTTFFCTG